jgi:hypothetical protein
MATDANGWTVFTPSADTHKIYVSNSTGSDATGDGTFAHPYQTIAKGESLLRDGYPDWLLLKAGDTWTGEAFNFVQASGRSAAEPMLISSYGSGARPVVAPNPDVNSVGIGSLGGPGHGGDFLAVVGIEFYNYTRDPANPSFDPTNRDMTGAVFLNPATSLLIEDSKFSFFADNIDIDLQFNPTPDSTVTIRRNVIVDSYSIDSHSQGVLIGSVAHPVIEENVFDHNGWNASVAGADRTQFNHAIYITDSNGPAIVTGNIFANSSDGVQARSGGVVYNNLFVDLPIAGFVAGVPSTVTQNVILGGINFIADSWGFSVNGGASGSVVQNNIVAHSNSATPTFAFDIQSGDSGVTLTNNIIYSWGSSGQILDNGSGDITTPNAIDLTGYPDPNRSVESYNSTLGGTATLEAFLLQARLQSMDNWHLQYTADAVNDYIREGFGAAEINPSPPPEPVNPIPPASPENIPPASPEIIPPASPEPVNHAPVVTVPSPTVQAMAGETLQVSDLFSAIDADNDTLTFLLNDTTPGGGHFVVNGVEQAANQVFSATLDQMGQTTFVRAVGGSDDETFHLGDLIATGGDALAYILYDATPGGGHFAVNGVDVGENQIFAVTPAQLAQTTFVPAIGGSDDLLVGVINEYGFGWTELHII